VRLHSDGAYCTSSHAAGCSVLKCTCMGQKLPTNATLPPRFELRSRFHRPKARIRVQQLTYPKDPTTIAQHRRESLQAVISGCSTAPLLSSPATAATTLPYSSSQARPFPCRRRYLLRSQPIEPTGYSGPLLRWLRLACSFVADTLLPFITSSVYR